MRSGRVCLGFGWVQEVALVSPLAGAVCVVVADLLLGRWRWLDFLGVCLLLLQVSKLALVSSVAGASREPSAGTIFGREPKFLGSGVPDVLPWTGLTARTAVLQVLMIPTWAFICVLQVA